MRIAMFGGSLRHWGMLYPNALTDDVPSPGGTELAMMQVSRSLARRGHHVTVFAECEPGIYEGVEYLKADIAIYLMSQLQYDVVVSWQDSTLFVHPIKARLKVLMNQSAHLGLGQAAPFVDRYFGISRFSAKLLLDSDPYADPSKMWITRNGVDPKKFEEAEQRAQAQGIERNNHRLLWASSPDRGLHHLLPIFRLVRERIPDAELVIAYDFDKTLADYNVGQPGSAFTRFLEEAAELKKEPGVTFLQHVSQPVLADLMVTSGVLVYPCDPIRPTETYCNVVSEALAAGMDVVISEVDCLKENYAGWATTMPMPVDSHYEAWAATLALLMLNEDAGDEAPRHNIAQDVRRICAYDEVATDWEAFFEDFLAGRETTSDRSLSATRELHD